MTIDQILLKLRTAFLGLVLALSLFMPVSTWADSNPSYITDVILVGGTSSEVSDAKSSHTDFTFIDVDLNAGLCSDHIYLGYKTSATADLHKGYITDFIVINAESSTNPPSNLTFNSRIYNRPSSRGGTNFRSVNGNLNSSCYGGSNLYLYYTKDHFDDKRVVSSIDINSTRDGAVGLYYTNGYMQGIVADLNCKSKGSRIYMHFSTTTKKNRLSREPVMASGLVYNGQPQKLIETTANAPYGFEYYKVGSESYTPTASQVKATSAGSYTVYYYAGRDDFIDASDVESQTVTIAKSPNSSASVYIASTLYADETISPSISGTNLSTGAVTYMYATSQNGDYSTTKPFGEGTYWVKATISGDDNCYEYTTSAREFSIIKRQNDNATMKIASSVVYGESLNPSVTDNLSTGLITYKYATSQDGSYNTTEPTSVGTYWVKATIASDFYYYEYTTAARSFEITKAPLTISAKNKTITYGDEPADNGVEYSGFVREDDASVLGGTLVLSIAYTPNGPVGEYVITPFGVISDNYEITFVNGTLTVEPKEITIAWDKQTSFVYNGTEQAPTATAESLVEGDECVITVSGAKKNVGEYTATATALNNGNYKLPADVERSFEITPKEISIAWGEQTSFVYNGTEQAPTATAGSLVAGDECLITVQGAKDVGEYTATATALNNGNYKLPEDVKKPFEITPKEITIAWGETSFVYNGTEQAPTATAGSLVAGDGCVISVSGAAKDVGEHTATATELNNSNYKLPADVDRSFEITPKEISIAWGETSFVYNGTEQAPTATAGSLVAGDECVISVSGAAKDVGMYAASVTGLSNDNYKLPTENLEKSFEIAYTNLALLNDYYVAQDGEVLTGSLAGNYKVSIADGATVTLDGVTINGVNKSAYKWAGITCEGDCNIVLAENSVNTVKGFDCDYPGIFVPEGKTLTISGTGSLEARSNGQGAGIGGGWYINCGNIVVSGGTVKSTGGSLAAGIGGGTNGSVGNITISGGTVESTGGSKAAGIGGSHKGSVNDITISGGVVTATGGDDGAGIGSGYYNSSVESVTISGGIVTASGGQSGAGIGSGNYGAVGNITITDDVTKVTATKGTYAPNSVGVGDDGSRTGIITIGGKESEDISTSPFVHLRKLTVTAKNNTIVYGDKPADNGVEYAGFLDGDDASVLSGTLSFSTDYEQKGNVGDYSITPEGLTSDKYNVVFESGTLTVEPKEITISWGKQTLFVYNGTEQAPTATADGLVNGDECSITVSGAAKNIGGHTATATALSNNNYKLPTENLEKFFVIGYTNLASLNDDYVAHNGEVLTGSLAGNYKVSIADGATVTLNGVTINGVNNKDYNWAGITCEGDCNIILAESSVNTVKGFYRDYPGIYVPEGKTLTISGPGSLDASSNGRGAGIGGGRKIGCGYVVISGGSVTASGGTYAAAIGGGYAADVGGITITEGVTKVVATKDDDAPYSIGAGMNGSRNGEITIGSSKTVGVSTSPFVFTGATYTVVFDANGGNGTMEKQNLYSGFEQILLANEFTRDGFSFAGWTTDVSGNGRIYGDKVNVIDLTESENSITLYARWVDESFTNLSAIEEDYVAQNGEVLVGMIDGLSYPYKLSIADGATVTLNGVTIDGVDDSRYKWAGITCEGDCNIILAENSVNTVTGFYGNYPGIYVPEGKTLTISGSGSLDATSGGVWGAGIGSGYMAKGGNIVIAGGAVTARGGKYGAGIGSGGERSSVGNITISGGDVTAIGGLNGAGIGSGIGSGECSVGNVTISGGVVTANGGNYGAGIGSGFVVEYQNANSSYVKNVTISGGVVTASGGDYAAGIGSGWSLDGNANSSYVENVTISGGVVTANGGRLGAGIGGGYKSTSRNITITDDVVKVTATKGTYALNEQFSIGAGYEGSRTGTITIGGKEYEDGISTSPFVYPAVVADYPAAKIYEYSSGVRAVINADYTGKGTLSIPDPIVVDSVEVTRTLTPLTPATTVLPFTLPEGTTFNASFYYLKAVEQVGCSWKATMKHIGLDNLPEANTPYAVVLNKGESSLKFDMHGKQATVQTGEIADKIDETGKWYFKGLYSYKVWENNDEELGLAYGFAGSNNDGVAKGKFGRLIAGAYAVPMRSYLRKTGSSVRLNCPAAARAWGAGANSAGFASANADVIDVTFVEDDENGEEKTTAVGRMNSVTGEIKIDRWYDLKGRRVNNVNRATKGAYYGKKVLKK